MKKILGASLLVCNLAIAAMNDDQTVFFDVHNGNFPNATVEQAAMINAPQAQDFHFHQEPEHKTVNITTTHKQDNSWKEFFGTGLKGFLQSFCQLLGQDAYMLIKNSVVPNEEAEMQNAVQQIQIRRAEQQLDAEKENIELMKEIRQNIAIVRILSEKETAGKMLTPQEKKQKEDAKRSLTLLQGLLSQAPAPAA
jgi:hypothetical protein